MQMYQMVANRSPRGFEVVDSPQLKRERYLLIRSGSSSAWSSYPPMPTKMLTKKSSACWPDCRKNQPIWNAMYT